MIQESKVIGGENPLRATRSDCFEMIETAEQRLENANDLRKDLFNAELDDSFN